ACAQLRPSSGPAQAQFRPNSGPVQAQFRPSSGPVLDDEAIDAAILAVLDEHVPGCCAERGEIGYGAGVGGQHLELGPQRQLRQRLAGLQDRQRTSQAFGIQGLVGHWGGSGTSSPGYQPTQSAGNDRPGPPWAAAPHLAWATVASHDAN